MKTRMAFFDVDGTLSAPRYDVGGGEMRIGLRFDEWTGYCEKYGEDTYKDCLPVPAVRDYALKLKKDGARLFVLTTSFSKDEDRAKMKFIRRYYDGIFEELISVPEDGKKITKILEMAEENGLSASECELVEDTYQLLLMANERDIRCTHISNLVS